MGISDADRREISNHYDNRWVNYFLGVTNGNKIWLPDEAFRSVSSSFTAKNDLPGIIVHELLHVAGLTDPFVSGLIGANCGWGGITGN